MSLHKTPLRYPGGKQKLAPFIHEILVRNEIVEGHYAEPYAGGAGVAMELLLTGKISHVHLNDSSFPIYAFWHSVFTEPETFCHLILSSSLNVEEWRRQKAILRASQSHSVLEVGFSTFYLNRCNRSGVLNGGVIGGLSQTGKWKIDARFSRNELIKRIEAIALVRDRITVQNCDAEEFMTQYIPTLPDNTLVYCDPPYFERSSGLYLNRYRKPDHERIARVIQSELPRRWVLSYDAASEILGYYSERRQFSYALQYNANRVYEGTEVFIFSDTLEVPQTSKLPFIATALQKIAGQPTDNLLF